MALGFNLSQSVCEIAVLIALDIPVLASRCFGVVEAFGIAGIGGFDCSTNFDGFDLGFTSFFS